MYGLHLFVELQRQLSVLVLELLLIVHCLLVVGAVLEELLLFELQLHGLKGTEH